MGEDHETKSFEAKQRGDFNPKGKKAFDGFAPGQSFKRKTSAEMAGEVKQAAQEAPEAIEQQRIPRQSQGIIKGFFRNLDSGKDREAKPEK
jgi:hypothetical protein